MVDSDSSDITDEELHLLSDSFLPSNCWTWSKNQNKADKLVT